MLEWNAEELDKGLAAAVCLLYLSEYITWIARAATAPGYGPYIIYSIPRMFVSIQLGIDLVIIFFVLYLQLKQTGINKTRIEGFRRPSGEHIMALVLFACLAATDLINIVNEREFAWLELALKVAYYTLLMLFSLIESTPTFKTLILLSTTVFAVMIVASNVAAETESGSSSRYLATVFENMLVVECAHMFYHLEPMKVIADIQTGLLDRSSTDIKTPEDAAQRSSRANENTGNISMTDFTKIPSMQQAAAAAVVEKKLNDKYDRVCWLLFFVFFGSEIITFIWRSAHDKDDFVYFVLMNTQAGINFSLFVAYLCLLCSRNGPMFVVTSHHVFTFFPFLALMAANTCVVRTEQGWTWLQLVIDLFGYGVLQIIAGLSIGSSKTNLIYSTMVCIFTAVFVLMIVVILAKHESETSPSLEFIKGVIEQILVLELFHLAFQKLIMDYSSPLVSQARIRHSL
jgi:hypothetical protein